MERDIERRGKWFREKKFFYGKLEREVCCKFSGSKRGYVSNISFLYNIEVTVLLTYKHQ